MYSHTYLTVPPPFFLWFDDHFIAVQLLQEVVCTHIIFPIFQLYVYSYGHLLVISGYFWDYTFYKNGVLWVLITGKCPYNCIRLYENKYEVVRTYGQCIHRRAADPEPPSRDCGSKSSNVHPCQFGITRTYYNWAIKNTLVNYYASIKILNIPWLIIKNTLVKNTLGSLQHTTTYYNILQY